MQQQQRPNARVIPFPGTLPPMPAVARILARYDRDKLEAFIAVAIDLIDTLDQPHDPDAPDFRPCSDGLPGDPDETERAGDEKDMSWPERIAQHRAGPNMGTEDDEADDFGEMDDGY
jgi:hypothetical protein